MSINKKFPERQSPERQRDNLSYRGKLHDAPKGTTQKPQYARAKPYLPQNQQRIYSEADFTENRQSTKPLLENTNINNHDAVFMLRKEIDDWKHQEALTSKIENKLIRIESTKPKSIGREKSDQPNSYMSTMSNEKPSSVQKGTAQVHSSRFMADHESPPATSFHDRCLPSCCCTNHHGCSTCTNCTGNHCHRTSAANYRSLTAGISGLASDRFQNINDQPDHQRSGRHLTGITGYSLDDYLINSQEKESSCSLALGSPVSPALSPETVDVLQNAERLVKDAQRQIMEVSYKTHLSPIQENGTGSTTRPPLDDNLLYLHELVAAKFNEANASNRNYRKIPSVGSVDVQSKEFPKLQEDQIPVKESQSFLEKKYELPSDKYSESSSRTKQKKPMAKEEDTFFERFQSDCTTSVDAFSATTLPPRRQPENGISTSSRNPQDSNTGVFRVNEGDRRSRMKFQIQRGPQVDIQRELTIQSVDNIHISPDPSSVPVYKNVATYEFQHETIRNNNLQKSKIPSATFIDIHQQPLSSRAKDFDAEMVGNKPLDQVDAKEHVEAVIAPEENIIANPPMDNLVAVGSEEIEIPEEKIVENNLDVDETKAVNSNLVENVNLQFDNEETALKTDGEDEALIKEITYKVSQKDVFYLQDPLSNEEFDLDNINLQAPNIIDLDKVLQVYSRSIDHIVRGTQKLSELLERRTRFEISSNQGKLHSNDKYILSPSTETLMTSLNLPNPLSEFKYPKITMNLECMKNPVFKENMDDHYVETCAMQNPSTRCKAITTKNVTENINESCQAIANSDCDQGPLDVTSNRNFVLTVGDSMKSNRNTRPWSVPIVIPANEKSLITSTRNDIHLDSNESTQYAKYDITSEEKGKLESKSTLEKLILVKQDKEKPSENLLSDFSAQLDKLLHVDSSFCRELKSNTGSSYNIHSNENAEFDTGAFSLLTSFRKPNSQDMNADTKNELTCTSEDGTDEDDEAHMVEQVLEALKHSSKAVDEFVTWLLDKKESNIGQDVTRILQKTTISPLIMDRFLFAIRQETTRTNVLSEEKIADNELRLTLGDWRKIYDLAKYFSQIAEKSEAHVFDAREPIARRDLSCVEDESYVKVSVENKKDLENLSAMKWLKEGKSIAPITDIYRKNITDNKVDFIKVHKHQRDQNIDSKLIKTNYKNSSEKSVSSRTGKSESQDKRIPQESVKELKQDPVKAKNSILTQTKRSDTTNDTSTEQNEKGTKENDFKNSLVTRCIRKKCPSIPSESVKEKVIKVATDIGTQIETPREEKSTSCNSKSIQQKDNLSKTTEECITYSPSTSAETISDFTNDHVSRKTESRIDTESSKDRSHEGKKVEDTAEKSGESQPIRYVDKSTSFSSKKVNYEKKIDTLAQDNAVEVQAEDELQNKNNVKSVSVPCGANQNLCFTEAPLENKSPVKSITRDSYKTKAKPDEGDALVNSDKQKSSGNQAKGSDNIEAKKSERSPEDKDDCQKNCLRDEKCKMICDNDGDDDDSKKRSQQPTTDSCEKNYQPCCKPLKVSNNSYHKKDESSEPITSAKQERSKRRLSWKEVDNKDDKTNNPKEKLSMTPKISYGVQKKDFQVFQCSKECTNDENCVFVCTPFHTSSLVDNDLAPPDPDHERFRSSVVRESEQEKERKLMLELRDAQENIKIEQDKARKAMAKLSELKKHRTPPEELYSGDVSVKGCERSQKSANQNKNASELTVIFTRTEDEHEKKPARVPSVIQEISSSSQGSDDVPPIGQQKRRFTVPINHISPSFDVPTNIHNDGEHVQYEDNNGIFDARSPGKRLISEKGLHNPSFSHSRQRRRQTIEAEYFEMPSSNSDENRELKAKEWLNKRKPFTSVSISENIARRFDKTQRGMDSNVGFAFVSNEKPFSTMKGLEHLFECCTAEKDLQVQSGCFKTSYQQNKRMEDCKFHDSLKYNEIFQDSVHKSVSDDIHEKDYSSTKQAVCAKPEIIAHFLGRRKLEDVKIERIKRNSSSESCDKFDPCSSVYIGSTNRTSNMLDHLKLCLVPTNAETFLTLKNVNDIHFQNITGYPLKPNEPSSATCSEGELYMPSSCSYSFGEIRVSRKSKTGGKVFKRADGMTIFVTSSALPSSDESSLESDSLGEI
ncbi:uncharacterized protein LOC107263885 isoform X2 [Cephus cinctus]|nr:uncharacterized protein LOC107263885 isoform X2 [Cephus cinctus]